MARLAKLNPLKFDSADFAPKFYDSRTPGPAIVLLHGTFGSTAGNFGLIYQALSARFRVIGLDFQETGGQLDVSDLVEQTAQLVRGLGLTRPHVLGYSQGAVAAGAFAGTHPDLVGRLILLCGWRRPDAYLATRHDIWRALRELDHTTPLRQFNLLCALRPDFIAGMSPAQLRAALNSPRFTSFGDKQMELNARADIADEVARIEADTLVLSCDQDVMIPPYLQQDLAAAIPKAQLRTLHGGHGIVLEDPDAVVAAVLDFLDS